MYTAPDGSQWYHGVRWFYEGAYHLKIKPGMTRRHATHYHVFASVADPSIQRVYRMQPREQVRVKLPELARRFANSHETERHSFDPKSHFKP